MEQRAQLRFVHFGFEREQRAELRIPVLLHHEQQSMRGEETLHVFREGEGSHTHVVHAHAFFLEHVDGFVDRPIAAADRDDADVAIRSGVDDGARHELLGRLPLAQEAVEHDLIFRGIFGVSAVLRVTRAAGEVGRFRMHARHRAIGNSIAILVEIAMKLLELQQLFLAEHLAAVGLVAVVPFEVAAHPVVHADIEIGQDEHGRLQPLGEIERLHGHVEALFRIRRIETHVARIAVRGVRGRHDVTLLSACGHAR